MTFPQRGAFARDKRTGALVRVTEEGMSGSDWMVRTVYKSDGYWAVSADLEPARDPHALRPRDLWKVAVLVALVALVTRGTVITLLDARVNVWDTTVYSACVAVTVAGGMSYILGLRRL